MIAALSFRSIAYLFTLSMMTKFKFPVLCDLALRQFGVGWGKVCTLIGYLLTDGFNCLSNLVCRLASGTKGCSSKTRFIYRVFRFL